MEIAMFVLSILCFVMWGVMFISYATKKMEVPRYIVIFLFVMLLLSFLEDIVEYGAGL